MADSKDALYIAFVGTKQRRDIITNANIMHEKLWPGQVAATGTGASQVSSCLVCTNRQTKWTDTLLYLDNNLHVCTVVSSCLKTVQ